MAVDESIRRGYAPTGKLRVALNFGNIWAARNAPFLIEQAMAANTGGMGSLRPYFTAQDLADIAAYIGNFADNIHG